ncbi:MAG: LPXTG cell wall anchor domain-containing protein [Clostridia bacterium]|nr:LPXTG cell wall anchor domain-containing protein [Clostridia bacterium]
MKKTISIIMIILMVILVSGKCFATDGALDLTNTLGTPDSTNDSIVDLNPPANDENTAPNVTDDQNLPKAGVADTTAFIVIGVACVAIGIYAFKKMRYYTDV